ncbi:hypothetical protein [Pseudomonas sp. PLMAX]|uniref:hypothetical protein n=1 Tax=Pseudomonas sp. PLMAX TaxID=2201998 RepID=UPI0038BCD155
MTGALYLEVDRSNGAILSYSNEQLKSSTSDFIETTEAELNYLNHLEDNVFPAGTIATLSDLQAYRSKVKAFAQGEAKAAQLKATRAQLTIQRAKFKAQLGAIQAKKDALLKAGAALNGVTVAEYEAECIAQYAASQAHTDAPLMKSGKTRAETAKILRQMQAKSKRHHSN